MKMSFDDDEEFAFAAELFAVASEGGIEPCPQQINQSSSAVTPRLTPALIVKRVYYLGRILAKVFEDTNQHYWASGLVYFGSYIFLFGK